MEHLVQGHGIARAHIFVQPEGTDNSAGERPSGGDASHGDETRGGGANHGAIEMSADIKNTEVAKARRAFEDAGGLEISFNNLEAASTGRRSEK